MIRFWSKVAIKSANECWEWIANKNYSGYGHFGIEYKIKRAHRVSWELTNGLIPQDSLVCHTCDNPSCVNPNHLFLGSPLDNTKDMNNKNRNGHKNKTHCKQGHEYNLKNTYVYKNRRECRKCRSSSMKKFNLTK